MPVDFESFVRLIREKSPTMTYNWTREKEISCQWIIDKIRPGTKGLDVGGTAWMCQQLESKGCDVTCYDLAPVPNFPKYVQGDMIDLMNHFQERSFDFITTRHTLEHSLAPFYQLHCYNRLLKDHGKLYVIVPTHIREWIWFHTHHSCLPLENWLMLFIRAGFRLSISDAGSWGPNDAKHIEHRFELIVESRELRLDYSVAWLPF
jgi:SAM-dependent methyltransferase